jgi:hypothetical protein
MLDPQERLKGEATRAVVGMTHDFALTILYVEPSQFVKSVVYVILLLVRIVIMYDKITAPLFAGSVHDIVTKLVMFEKVVVGAEGLVGFEAARI